MLGQETGVSLTSDLINQEGRESASETRFPPGLGDAAPVSIFYPALTGALSYSMDRETRAYVDLTILATAKAIHTPSPHAHDATILVDGLKRSEQHRFATGLRRLRVHVEKVRGAREESDALVRLADAFCGLIRDGLEGQTAAQNLYRQAKAQGAIKELA